MSVTLIQYIAKQGITEYNIPSADSASVISTVLLETPVQQYPSVSTSGVQE